MQAMTKLQDANTMPEPKPQDANTMPEPKLQDSSTMPEPSNPITRVLPTTPAEAMVVPPCAKEEAMSEKAQRHRILRSSDSTNKRVPSSLFAAPPEAVNEKKRKGEEQNAGRKRSLQGEVENHVPAAQNVARKRSLQGGEVRSKRASIAARPSTSASSRATAASAAAAHKAPAVPGSRVTRQQQPPAASSNKTKGWVR